MLSVKSLHTDYAAAGGAVVNAVQDVSFDVPDGELFTLLGPSGCGKTTTLRSIAGLERPRSGSIALDGRVVYSSDKGIFVAPNRRNFGMVFQSYAIWPHMNVFKNVAFPLEVRKARPSRKEIEQKVMRVLATVQLAELVDRDATKLSGGQRQRVAMGRAIVRQPKAFLFDEPLSNLDAKLRVSMRVEIRKLQRAFATTSIYVTHDQLEAMTLADLLVVMNAGRVEQIGAPLEVYEKPASTFVAAFIGAPAMNLLEMSAAEAASLIPGREVPPDGAVIGVRPDDLKLDGAQPGPPAGLALDLAVTAVERVGPECFVYGAPALGHGEIIVRVPGTAAPAIGQRVWAVAPPDRLHLFSTAGRRLSA